MTATAISGVATGSRPATLTWAVWTIVVGNIVPAVVAPFLPGADDIPVPAIIFGSAVGVVSVVLCWWLWQCKKWAAITLTVITGLNMLSSLPGLVDSPSRAIDALIIIGIPLTLIPIWLMWHPASRKAYRGG